MKVTVVKIEHVDREWTEEAASGIAGTFDWAWLDKNGDLVVMDCPDPDSPLIPSIATTGAEMQMRLWHRQAVT